MVSLERMVEGALGRGERDRALVGDQAGGLQGALEQLVGLVDGSDEADPQRLLGIDDPSREVRSFATPTPQTRASRCVPPQPGMIPRLISGWPSLAFLDA